MGGVRVDPESQMSSVPGLFAAGECGAGLHGANRLGGNSLSDLLVFGKRAGEHAASFAREHGAGRVDDSGVERAAKELFDPFDRIGGENPYQLQHELQTMMQDLVGIVRKGPEMEEALAGIGRLRERAARVHVVGNREYNPGWHLALDLPSLFTVSEAVTRAALERRESRGAQFREDFPEKDAELGRVNVVVRRDPHGEMQVSREPIPALSGELKAIIEEMK
jgi:succinate dehydrogenase / fumarate reductase flavoprotein subunit